MAISWYNQYKVPEDLGKGERTNDTDGENRTPHSESTLILLPSSPQKWEKNG